jgi:hypothetical protein
MENTTGQQNPEALSFAISVRLGKLLALYDFVELRAHPTQMTVLDKIKEMTPGRIRREPIRVLVDVRESGQHRHARAVLARRCRALSNALDVLERDLLHGFAMEDLSRQARPADLYLRAYFEHRLRLNQIFRKEINELR